MSSPDFLVELGTLVLDHRFKRMSLRLLAETESVYERAGLEFNARWASTYKLLSREGELAVGEIAEQLRLTHPAIVQLTREMRRGGMLRTRSDPDDSRRRLVSLSDRARAMREELEALWGALEHELGELFAGPTADILDLLDAGTRRLDEKSLADRVLAAVES